MFGLGTLVSHNKFHYFKPNFDISLSLRVLFSKLGVGRCGNREYSQPSRSTDSVLSDLSNQD